MPNRDERSREELRDASFHVDYELSMLFISRVELSKTASGDGEAIRNAFLVNAILESFLLHARNLIDFFYGGSPFSDDVTADNFTREWATLRPEITELLEETKRQANKHLAHLTYQRSSIEESVTWDYEGIENDIKKVFKRFFEVVSEDKLCGKMITKRMLVQSLSE